MAAAARSSLAAAPPAGGRTFSLPPAAGWASWWVVHGAGTHAFAAALSLSASAIWQAIAAGLRARADRVSFNPKRPPPPPSPRPARPALLPAKQVWASSREEVPYTLRKHAVLVSIGMEQKLGREAFQQVSGGSSTAFAEAWRGVLSGGAWAWLGAVGCTTRAWQGGAHGGKHVSGHSHAAQLEPRLALRCRCCWRLRWRGGSFRPTTQRCRCAAGLLCAG